MTPLMARKKLSADIPSLVSVSALSNAYGIAWTTVAKRLVNAPVADPSSEKKLYRLTDVTTLIDSRDTTTKGAGVNEAIDGGLSESLDKLSPDALKTYWQARSLEETTLEKARKNALTDRRTVEASEVMPAIVQVFTLISRHLQALPDHLERDSVITSEHTDDVAKSINRFQETLAHEVKELVKEFSTNEDN